MQATVPSPSGGVTDREAVERLNELEESERLFDVRVGEWCAWPLLKTEVMMKLTGLQLKSHGKPPSSRWRVGMALLDASRLVMTDRRDVLIKTGTATLLDRSDGKYKDFLFDDLALSLESVNKIETVIDESHVERRAHSLVPATLTSCLPEVLAGIAWRASPGTRQEAAARRFSSVLRQRLGLVDCTPDWASIRLRHFDATRRAYAMILRRMCGRVLLVGDPGEFGAVAAARGLGLHTVELQHGLLNAYHPGYAWAGAPQDVWSRIPVAEKLFAFGQYWMDALAEIPFWSNRVEVAGSLRMDAYRDLRRAKPRGQRVILFTTQGIDATRAIAFLKEARSKQRERNTLLVIKLHPAFESSKDEYLEAFRDDSGVNVQLASEGPTTLEWLARVDLHLSISSFCHYEACALGVPTVVLPLRTSESINPMVAAKHAIRAESSDELARLLDGAIPAESVAAGADYYFQRGAVSRMRSALARMN